MDTNYICCLCFEASDDYELMQNDGGESTEIYDITVKYFDPMILNENQEGAPLHTTARVLCRGCWTHIFRFHEFQQCVLKARAMLHEVKEQKIDMCLVQEMPIVAASDKYQPSEYDTCDEKLVDFSSDLNDEVPLQTLLQQARLRARLKNRRACGKSKLSKNISCNVFTSKSCKDSPSPISVTTDQSVVVKREDDTSDHTKQCLPDSKTLELSFQDSQQAPSSENHELEIKLEDMEDNKSLSDESEIPSSKRTYTKHKKSVRKRSNNKTHPDKVKKTSNGKFKEKRKEDDLFIAQWKPILDCDLCPATVSNFDEMRDHFTAAHGTRYYIKCCERKFYRRYALIAHIRLHVNPETYKCDICGRLSTTKHNLHLHKKIVHSQSKEFECEICHKLFNQKPNLERHLLIHVEGEKKFFCNDCGRGYVLEVQLKSHIKSVHEVNNICDQCGKICHGQGALKTHLMEHAGVKRRKHPCDICGIEIVSKIGLKRHKAAFHHDGSTAYVCGICGKVTSSENALMHHKKYVHEKVKKHKCTYCDKAFMQPKGLREHIASHTGVDLYQCPHCPQTFKVSANMHHHRKRAHPVEWEEARRYKVALPKVNIEQCTNQVVL